MEVCYIALGSNLGRKRENILSAIRELQELRGLRLLKVSSFVRTKAAGGPKGQPDYLNAAIKIKTVISPQILLKKIKDIEKKLGRVKTVRNGARIIDIDILLYGERRIHTRQLIIPHPRMFKRDFVIRPLSEVICG